MQISKRIFEEFTKERDPLVYETEICVVFKELVNPWYENIVQTDYMFLFYTTFYYNSQFSVYDFQFTCTWTH